MAENVRSSRKSRNPTTTPADRQIDPANALKPTTISSILLSSGKKNNTNFTSATFRGLGCTASSHVSVPAAITSSANWETTHKKKRLNKSKKSRDSSLDKQNDSIAASSSSSSSLSLALSSSCVGVPDVWCAPGITLATDATNVVSRRPARAKVDGVDKIINLAQTQRERPYTVRRMVTSEDIPFLESENVLGMHRIRSDIYGSRHHRHVRHGLQEGLAEIVMLQRGRSDGVDRYRDLRLDVDNMSYEELVELGEKIGYVNTGLREDEISCCLRRSKLATWDDFSSHFVSETEKKCTICQEEYEANEETGKLNCGHFYHIDCIKQWLGQKNICPICKTAALSQI